MFYGLDASYCKYYNKFVAQNLLKDIRISRSHCHSLCSLSAGSIYGDGNEIPIIGKGRGMAKEPKRKVQVHITVTGADDLTPEERERAAEIARKLFGGGGTREVEVTGVDPESEAE
jgi:voltage-gated potassium channel Kch